MLIAHQSTIPHYRVPFYNELERRRPDSWTFEVVFDRRELTSPTVFFETIDSDELLFPILDRPLRSLNIGGRSLRYQHFIRAARRADAVIVEHAVSNLAYPTAAALKLMGLPVAFWGHGRHIASDSPSPAKRATELAKRQLARWADGYFAYTEGVKHYLVDHGVSEDKVFVVQNTIDLESDRRQAVAASADRQLHRRTLGLRSGDVALLFVGRPKQDKRLGFLLEAFDALRSRPDGHRYRLILVGPEEAALGRLLGEGIEAFGPITSLDRLAPIYAAADVFAYPGAVGLAPLQALAHGLPAVVIASPFHKPEFDYLNQRNSIVLPRNTTPADYAAVIADFDRSPLMAQNARDQIRSTVQHLTIEQMADNFIVGVERFLARGRSAGHPPQPAGSRSREK